MNQLERLAGRWALVTGGADGIGLALCRGFASAGMRVVVLDLRAEAAEAAASELRRSGADARSIVADVSDSESMAAAAASLSAIGVVPALVWANAGVGAGGGFLSGSARSLEWLYAVNVFGVMWTARAFAEGLFAEPGTGHFGVTASSASVVDVRGPFTSYAASKHATAAVGEALAAEFAEHGVGVTLLYPSLLNTNIWDAGRARPLRFGGEVRTPESISAYWRAAPDADVVTAPVLRTIAAGGGRCIVDAQEQTRAPFEARVDALRHAFAPNQ